MLWDEPKIFFLERRYFFSIILSEFLKNRVALQLHSFFYFNDEKPTDADFEKAIGDYLTFEFSMIMQNREYLFKNGGADIAED